MGISDFSKVITVACPSYLRVFISSSTGIVGDTESVKIKLLSDSQAEPPIPASALQQRHTATSNREPQKSTREPYPRSSEARKSVNTEWTGRGESGVEENRESREHHDSLKYLTTSRENNRVRICSAGWTISDCRWETGKYLIQVHTPKAPTGHKTTPGALNTQPDPRCCSFSEAISIRRMHCPAIKGPFRSAGFLGGSTALHYCRLSDSRLCLVTDSLCGLYEYEDSPYIGIRMLHIAWGFAVFSPLFRMGDSCRRFPLSGK